MNPIIYALQQVRYEIPKEVLEKVFLSNLNYRTTDAKSLDARIRELVIEPRVLTDCNLVGGTELTINIPGQWVKYIAPTVAIVTIPKAATQNRTITRALSISYGTLVSSAISGINPTQGSELLNAASKVMQSQMTVPVVSTAQVNVVGENILEVRDNIALPMSLVARVWIENDENFNHLAKPSWIAFSEGVVFAVKAYIYINSQIPMDQTYIQGGGELGRFTEVVDGYSDANENYKDWITKKWRKVAMLNDPEAMRRHIMMATGSLW